MKNNNIIFSSLHSIYRLSLSSGSIKNFACGASKIYRQVLNAEEVTIICKNSGKSHFIKVCLKQKKIELKQGSISILTRWEKKLLSEEKRIENNKKMADVIFFSDILGMIYITRHKKSNDFNDYDKKCFTALNEVTAGGLKIFQLHYEENKMLVNYVKSLTNLLTQHEGTSKLNTKTTERLINAIGKEMKLTEAELKSLKYAAVLHDAGKIQLPSELLTKQQRLTSDEFKIIMKHPRKGVDFIKNLQFLKPAIPIILHHHERFDGNGYPARLKKEQIPLGSRILSVLNAFDAMYFGRPYRKRKQIKIIKEELKKEKGRQFDPKVIDSFLKILNYKNIRKFLRLND